MLSIVVEIVKIQIKKREIETIKKNKQKILLNIKGKYKDRIAEYKERNKERIVEYSIVYRKSYDFALYNRNRRKDPMYKLGQNIRNLIKNAFLRKFTKKSKRTTEILGCDFNFFSEYLSSLFDDKMKWDNYGVIWEIDHIIPISSAENEEDLIKLNHYLNLRPLLKEENRKKGKKY